MVEALSVDNMFKERLHPKSHGRHKKLQPESHRRGTPQADLPIIIKRDEMMPNHQLCI